MATAKKKTAKLKYDPDAKAEIATVDFEYEIPYTRKVRVAIPITDPAQAILAQNDGEADYIDAHIDDFIGDMTRLAARDVKQFARVIERITVQEVKPLEVDAGALENMNVEGGLPDGWEDTIRHTYMTVQELMDKFGFTEAKAVKLLPKPVKKAKGKAAVGKLEAGYDFYASDPGIDLVKDAKRAAAVKTKGKAVAGPEEYIQELMEEDEEDYDEDEPEDDEEE